jgi:hypothetical protein
MTMNRFYLTFQISKFEFQLSWIPLTETQKLNMRINIISFILIFDGYVMLTSVTDGFINKNLSAWQIVKRLPRTFWQDYRIFKPCEKCRLIYKDGVYLM